MRLLLSTCASLYCSHAKQIKEDLDDIEQQANATLPTGKRRTLPQRDTETAKNDISAFGSDALDQCFLVYATTGSLISQLDGH